jgi:hypothetical protein
MREARLVGFCFLEHDSSKRSPYYRKWGFRVRKKRHQSGLSAIIQLRVEAMEVGKKTATCPILKKENSHYTADTATTATTNSTLQLSEAEGGGKEKKHVEWDEHAIEEHDLLRGTRMKVSQPMMMMMICCIM